MHVLAMRSVVPVTGVSFNLFWYFDFYAVVHFVIARYHNLSGTTCGAKKYLVNTA